ALTAAAALAPRARAAVTPVTPPPVINPTPLPAPTPPPGGTFTTVPDQFVVVIRTSVAVPVIQGQKRNSDRAQQALDNQPARLANLKVRQGLYAKYGIPAGAIRHQYADVLVGFAAKLTREQTESLRADPAVEGVYPDVAARLEAFITPEVDAEANQAHAFV